jgi:hypothetical protein
MSGAAPARPHGHGVQCGAHPSSGLGSRGFSSPWSVRPVGSFGDLARVGCCPSFCAGTSGLLERAVRVGSYLGQPHDECSSGQRDGPVKGHLRRWHCRAPCAQRAAHTTPVITCIIRDCWSPFAKAAALFKNGSDLSGETKVILKNIWQNKFI